MHNSVFLPTCLLLFVLLLNGCEQTPATAQGAPESLVFVDTPARFFSAQPKLVKNSAGQIYLSWIQHNANESATLQAAAFADGVWQDAFDIANGTNWFINWADFPTLALHDSQKMAASFLSKSGAGTYAYDVQLTTSDDGGASWNQAFSPHDDGTASEHGFVSLLPWKAGRFMAVWLDGRHTAADAHGGHGQGAMSLRSAQFDLHGKVEGSVELDGKTCDCCQTAAVRVGPERVLVAYRDRSDDEIRDIATVRYEHGAWSAPRIVHADQWKIAGCPVNGPALDSYAGKVAIAWFTAANDQPNVKFAISRDSGDTFSDPVTIDAGNPIGRVAVAFIDEKTAVVSWLERTADEAAIQIRVISVGQDGRLLKSEPVTIAKTSASRQSGFPQMVSSGHHVVFAWTEMLEKDRTIVRSAYAGNDWLASFPRH